VLFTVISLTVVLGDGVLLVLAAVYTGFAIQGDIEAVVDFAAPENPPGNPTE
jgi:hypothetical protein